MEMPGRNFSSNSYRYGFNGKENVDELISNGRGQDYGERDYRTDLCRFLSVDPYTKKYPELTPYQFASNTPIQAIDLDGLEKHRVFQQRDNNGFIIKIVVITHYDAEGKIVDQNIKKDGVDFSGKDYLVIDQDASGKSTYSAKSAGNLTRIQKEVEKRGKKTTDSEKVTRIEGNENGKYDKLVTSKSSSAEIKTDEFDLSTIKDNPTEKEIKPGVAIIHNTDEYKVVGPASKKNESILKKTLSTEDLNKSIPQGNNNNVPAKGGSEIKTATYSIKK